jgi:polyribonucleotide nucleotidyltransferase
MDAGVPILAPVAGIAMGLMTHPDDAKKFKVLTDIQGIEDHSGDMDFKVAGTTTGITAIQLDIKLGGISLEVVKEAITKAKDARLQILEVIKSAIAEPRKELSPYAPRIVSLKIDPSKIGMVIGKGGETINKIIDETGVQIDIDDDGLVMVTSASAQGIEQAIKWIENLTHEITVGEIYDGKVVRIMDFGAFVELVPGQDGMVHISELAWGRTNKVIGVDDSGKISLSHRELLPKPEGFADMPPSRPSFRPRGGDDRGGHGGRPARGRF